MHSAGIPGVKDPSVPLADGLQSLPILGAHHVGMKHTRSFVPGSNPRYYSNQT